MSTRALIALVDGTTYAASYVHHDGYPTGLAPRLAALAARDGVAATVDQIREHNAWSILDPDAPDVTTHTPDISAPFGSPAWYAAAYARTEGDVVIPAQGVAMTGEISGEPFTGDAHLEEGRVSVDFGIQWAYLFTGTTDSDTLHIAACDRGQGHVIATLPVTDLANTADESAWTAVECGEHYERCPHYATAHAEVPQESRWLGMAQWLGHEPLTYKDAIAVTTAGGERIDLARGGMLHRNVWNAVTKDGGNVALYRMAPGGETKPMPGLTYHYPPTAAATRTEAERLWDTAEADAARAGI